MKDLPPETMVEVYLDSGPGAVWMVQEPYEGCQKVRVPYGTLKLWQASREVSTFVHQQMSTILNATWSAENEPEEKGKLQK